MSSAVQTVAERGGGDHATEDVVDDDLHHDVPGHEPGGLTGFDFHLEVDDLWPSTCDLLLFAGAGGGILGLMFAAGIWIVRTVWSISNQLF